MTIRLNLAYGVGSLLLTQSCGKSPTVDGTLGKNLLAGPSAFTLRESSRQSSDFHRESTPS